MNYIFEIMKIQIAYGVGNLRHKNPTSHLFRINLHFALWKYGKIFKYNIVRFIRN